MKPRNSVMVSASAPSCSVSLVVMSAQANEAAASSAGPIIARLWPAGGEAEWVTLVAGLRAGSAGSPPLADRIPSGTGPGYGAAEPPTAYCKRPGTMRGLSQQARGRLRAVAAARADRHRRRQDRNNKIGQGGAHP